MTTAPLSCPQTSRPDLVRRELTILAADISGYARLTEAIETATHLRLRSMRVDLVDPMVVSFRGQIIRNTGDGFLACFDSCFDAVQCAIEIQNAISVSEAHEPPDRRILLRMGLNFGDVIVDMGDIYGSGVNVAARLEQCAPPGGIVVSAAVFDRVSSRMATKVDDLGSLRLKNISRPVHAYSVLIPSVDRNNIDARDTRRARRTKVPSIAVIPFRSVESDQNDAYFAEGVVDEIIVALASIRGLVVISRTSTISVATHATDLQQIGQRLGVRYVLTGSLRRRGAELRVSYELADVEHSSVLWADRFDGPLAELFDLQDRIATRIVWTIAPHVREAELRRALHKKAHNMNAYDLVLQSIDLIYRMQFADFDRAGALLKRAIELDDGYASAYTYAALWQIHNINQGWTNDHKADSQEALRLASAAVQRDPADGFALAICGHVKSVLLRDYDGAIELFDRAVTATPSNAMVWTLSSGVYSYTGRSEEAIQRAEKGIRLSPIDTQAFFYLSFLALAHYLHGTYDEAIIWARKSMSLNPRLCANMRWLTCSLVALGRIEEARNVAQSLLTVQPRFRVSGYSEWCPLRDDLRAVLIERLRTAGIPE
jgi:adenylate cyclase